MPVRASSTLSGEWSLSACSSLPQPTPGVSLWASGMFLSRHPRKDAECTQKLKYLELSSASAPEEAAMVSSRTIQAYHGELVEHGGPEDSKLHSRLLGSSAQGGLRAAPWWMPEASSYRTTLRCSEAPPRIQGLVEHKANVRNDFWTTPSASLKYNPGLPRVRRAGTLTLPLPKVQNP